MKGGKQFPNLCFNCKWNSHAICNVGIRLSKRQKGNQWERGLGDCARMPRARNQGNRLITEREEMRQTDESRRHSRSQTFFFNGEPISTANQDVNTNLLKHSFSVSEYKSGWTQGLVSYEVLSMTYAYLFNNKYYFSVSF